MFHPLAMERIAAALPDVRLIVSLREPVARAWSHHQYETQQGFRGPAFRRGDRAWRASGCGAKRRRSAPTRGTRAYSHRHHTYLQRGHYAEQLERIHSLFSPEQVLVMRSESMFTDLAESSPGSGHTWAPARPPGRAGPAQGHPCAARHPPALHERLTEYYRPWNERLEQLPGVGFTWNEQQTKRTGHGDR